MKRILMQAYVKNSREAVAVYQQAFDAVLGDHVKNKDGSYYHSELNVYGQILSVAERTEGGEDVTGNIMQFCLHFGEGGKRKVDQAYDVLKEGARILVPLGPCDYCSYMVDMIDRFGIRWCLFFTEDE